MTNPVKTYQILDAELVDRVLERLGVPRAQPDLDHLNRVYAAWCRAIPFDNVYKRRHFASADARALPLAEPAEVLETFLAHGTGGTCWPLAIGMFALFADLGFNVRGTAGSMLGITPPDFGPSHGTIIVTLDGRDYLVDNTMLSEEVLLLDPNAETRAGAGGLSIGAEPWQKLWDVRFRMVHSDREVTCRLQVDGVGLDFFRDRLQRTREYSRFNQALYVRKNRGCGALAYGRGKLTNLDSNGDRTTTAIDSAEVRPLLVERFGFSEEIVETIPPDDEEATEVLS